MASYSQFHAEKLEGYLIASAKGTLKNDICAAKAWLLTAKVLYPHKFGVQFLAYQIEKTTNNMKETAKCFADLLTTFPNEMDLRMEVHAMTLALREFEESEMGIEKADGLVQLFYQLPPPVQRGLLLNCANNTPDAMDHCKLMLLLFRKFPSDVVVFGPDVMESLITAEKHSSHAGNTLNCFRKLLACDLQPLIAHSSLDLPPQSLLRLLDKSVELYLVYAFEGNRRPRRDETIVIDDPWARLWEVILHIGFKLKWDLASGFTRYWSRDAFFKTMSLFSKRLDEGSQRQMAFCTLIVLLRCVHEYLPIVEPGTQDSGFVLVEAFCQPENGQTGHASKMHKTEDDPNAPLVTASTGASSSLVPAFLAAMRCLDVLHSCEFVRREYMRLRALWKVDSWLRTFLFDAALYQGSYEQNVMLLQSRRPDDPPRASSVIPELISLTWSYRVNDPMRVVDTIAKVAGMLGNMSTPGVHGGNPLAVPTRRARHVHFLPITRAAILQYCVKVLLHVLNMVNSDAVLGHTLVLMQLNWPAESQRLNEISELITLRGGFGYSLFANYVINTDILERFAYLAGPNGPKLPLDIFTGTQQMHSQRRMSTRGVDKGAKEDFKMSMRAQVARWNESVDDLIVRFLKAERDVIQHSILT